MKNRIIAVLVAGLILFVWQYLSWATLGIHQGEMQYTENQDAVLEALSQHLTPGDYFVPQPAPGASAEEMSAYMERATGKPWAMVSYRSSMSADMAMPMIRSIIVDMIAAFLMVWLLGKMSNPDLRTSITVCIAVGLIGYLTIAYLNGIWFEAPSLSYLIDAIAQWGVVGLWLGWFLNRK